MSAFTYNIFVTAFYAILLLPLVVIGVVVFLVMRWRRRQSEQPPHA